MERTKKIVPVTIITGFLGAGKTTFLNHLISELPDTKFAIIENEFGDIPIDQELVINTENGVFEMSNGCLCCSLNTELIVLLDKLEDEKYQFDHLLVETTGIAEPDAVAETFLNIEKLSRFRLDATICLLDAQDAILNLDERVEARKQVSFSDALVINKTDLIDAVDLEKLRKHLMQYNPEALVFEAEFGKTTVEKLISLNAYEGSRVEKKAMQSTKVNENHEHGHYAHEHKHDHTHAHHHSDIESHSIIIEEALDPLKFEHWANVLLHLYSQQIYRIKGILHLKGEDNKVIFQSVRTVSRIEIGSAWEPGTKRETRLVCIVKNVERKSLERGLKQCISTERI
ncbi:MAG: CobW family GTP-binding protein [Cyclobacteriaceae bacterium]